MNTGVIVTIVIIVVLALIAFWAISTYNNLVSLRNRVANAWAQIDVQLKQRADLIPNLVNTVKGYAQHESSVFEEVTRARGGVQAAQASGNVAERMEAENRLSRAMVNVLAVSENYPELKANQNFMDLQSQLQTLESKIAYARQFYNDIVLKMNNAIEQFPSNIVAGFGRFERAKSFETLGEDREVPEVKF